MHAARGSSVPLTAPQSFPLHWLTAPKTPAAMRPATAKWAPKKSIDHPRSDILRKSFLGTMSKEAPLSIAEREFILEALRQDARLDGRGVDQSRPLKISFGDEYGHVKLELGKTRYARRNPMSISFSGTDRSF